MGPYKRQYVRQTGPVVNNWVVITTHNRHDMLHDLLADVPRDRTVIVDHRSEPRIREHVKHVIRCDCEPNISHLWNLGLDVVDAYAHNTDYTVTVLNDDLRIPPGTLEALHETVFEKDVDAAFPDVHKTLPPGAVGILNESGPHNLHYRMTGYCFTLRGDARYRADESLVWWYGDDDLEWRAADGRGVARVGGLTVEHLTPNASLNDSVLVEQTGRDRVTFIEKWGEPPW